MISDIRLQHFRSYRDAAFEFTPAVNIIVGPNGSGKTNLLEAILVAVRGASYRAGDKELIEYDQPWARLDTHLESARSNNPRTVKITNDGLYGKLTKTFEIEGRIFHRLSPARVLPAVVFEPNHLFMLSGSPELRRGYLDDLLEQIDPGYGRIRRDYRRVLAQRNALLKRYGHDAATQIFPWNIRLSELGGSITRERLALISEMNAGASQLYGGLAHRDTDVQLRYETKLPAANYATALLKALEHNFNLDVARGYTGNGPHRDDFSVLLDGRLTQTSASRGEARTAVLMLKIMELRLIEQSRSRRPLLLLDDVFSELDGSRRQALTAHLQDYQTFITTTDADMVVHHFMDRCTVIPLG